MLAFISILVLVAIIFTAFTRGQRKAVFKREDGNCENCGRDWNDGYMLEVHHMQPLHEGGSDTLDNAELLCRPDHALRHEDLAYEAGKRGDGKAKKLNERAAASIRSRSIWRRGHEDNATQTRMF